MGVSGVVFFWGGVFQAVCVYFRAIADVREAHTRYDGIPFLFGSSNHFLSDFINFQTSVVLGFK